MADTERSLAQLQALLADNATGDISPQDIRDMLVSLTQPYGSFSTATASATTIAVAGTYYKMAGTTQVGNVRQMSMPSNGRLQYDGVSPRHFHIAVSVSMTTSNVNNIVGLKIAKNGTVLDDTIVRRFVSTGTDVGSTAVHGDVALSNGDYLELFVTNETDTDSVTVEEVYFFALGMLM